MKTLAEIRKEREESQLRYQRDKELKEATGVQGRISLLKVQSGVKYAIRYIHSFENTADFMYHNYNGDFSCKEICFEHYDGENCPFCNSVSTEYGKRFATATKFGLAHVYSLVDKEFDFPDPNTGERIHGKYNPLKLIALPIGKKDIYIKPLIASNKRKSFQSDIFLIERTKGSGWEVPEVITEEELQALVGPKVPLALPSEYGKYAELSKRNLWKLFLTAIPNARVDDLLGPDPAAQTASKVVTKNPFAVPAKEAPAIEGIDSAFV